MRFRKRASPANRSRASRVIPPVEQQTNGDIIKRADLHRLICSDSNVRTRHGRLDAHPNTPSACLRLLSNLAVIATVQLNKVQIQDRTRNSFYAYPRLFTRARISYSISETAHAHLFANACSNKHRVRTLDDGLIQYNELTRARVAGCLQRRRRHKRKLIVQAAFETN